MREKVKENERHPMGGGEIEVEKLGLQTCIYLGAHDVCKLNLEQSCVDYNCHGVSILIKIKIKYTLCFLYLGCEMLQCTS